MAKRVHFIGIGGVGMAALAVLRYSQGDDVSGCDLGPTPRTKYLESLGIKVFYGHAESHLEGVEEVIVTPAVDRNEPEFVKAAENSAIRVRYRGEALAEIVSLTDSIAVCGSHGKTTTSTFIAKLLKNLGEEVSWCIGGETGDFPVASPLKACGPLVVEADESDGTLALYRAKTLVVNKCEYDHPDFFKTEKDYFSCFEMAKLKAGEVIDAEALEMDGWEFEIMGEHNRRNARVAVEVALKRGHKKEDIIKALPSVLEKLPDRRFEKIAPGVYTDYAHHPTEMKCAISMAREICRGKLRVLFQPHRYSRTKALLKDFPGALKLADEVVLCPTYAAFEQKLPGAGVAELYRECRENSVNVLLARSCQEAWTHAALSRSDGDITLLLGAGDIVKISGMAQKNIVTPGKKNLIGMGFNTWRSDLKNLDEYVKSDSPCGASGATVLDKAPFMAGIPGTIGGWIKMNAGAFGHSISEVVSRVKVDGEWLENSECGFGYRTSKINGEIQDVEWTTPKSDLEILSTKEYLARRKKFPEGTYGSFFKNPPGDYAGRLLEEADLKGFRVGGAYVWEEHANVIVRGEGAIMSDVLALAKIMHDKVKSLFGVDLEPEVCGITL